MPLWISDFLGKTVDLDAAESGAYLLLLMAQWNMGGSLPNDQKKLQRIARCGRNWPKIWAAISHYFNEDERGLFNQTGREVYKNVASKREVNSQNGALGGNAKALKSKNMDIANATISPERKSSISESESYSEREEEKEEGKPSSKKPRRRCRLPEGWIPSPRNIEDAYSQQFTDEEIENEGRRFRDYHHAKGTTFADWDAGWRTWVSNARKFAGAAGNSRVGSGTAAAFAAVAARHAGYSQ